MRLHQAIIEFLANELHLDVAAITAETTFAELGVTPDQQSDLLQRMQESLGIILPEDQVSNIQTVGDVLAAAGDQETEA